MHRRSPRPDPARRSHRPRPLVVVSSSAGAAVFWRRWSPRPERQWCLPSRRRHCPRHAATTRPSAHATAMSLKPFSPLVPLVGPMPRAMLADATAAGQPRRIQSVGQYVRQRQGMPRPVLPVTVASRRNARSARSSLEVGRLVLAGHPPPPRRRDAPSGRTATGRRPDHARHPSYMPPLRLWSLVVRRYEDSSASSHRRRPRSRCWPRDGGACPRSAGCRRR